MRADEANLLRLLKKVDQLMVPIYQRRYSWTEDEWRQLWADIERIAGDTDGPDHFVGSLVVIGGVASGSGFNGLQVIDGQQRITTVSLLLLALQRAAEERLAARPDDPDAAYVLDEQIHAYCLLNDRERGDRRFKLLPNEGDRATYLALVEGAPTPDRPARRVVDALRHFTARIDASEYSLRELLDAVSRLVVVEIALERGRDNPQLIFESLNSTGLDLTQADLIRNYILMSLGPAAQEDLYRNYWQPMEERLAPVGPEGFDRFVRDYLTMRTAQIPKVDQIYRAFKVYVATSGEAAVGLAGDLHRFSAHYAAIVTGSAEDPEVRAALADIVTLRVEVAYPFLLDVLDDHTEGKITRDQLLQVLRMVESYVFRRAVAGAPTAALNKIFAGLSREVDEERYIESLTAALLLKEGSGRFPRNEEFRRELLAKDIYSFRNRSYLFDKIENRGRKERVEVSAYTVEHVMPQNPELSPEWQDELGPDWERVQAEHLHTLGNLTLTGYNAELSDRPFAEKLAMAGGFRDSPIRLNESVRAHSRWTEDAIRERGAMLADLAAAVWPLPHLGAEVFDRYRTARRRTKGTYTLADHPALIGSVRALFEELRVRVGNLAPEVAEEVRKQYIGFRAGRTFLSVVPLASELKLFLAGIGPDEINDPDERVRDVRGVGHWGQGDIELRLADATELDMVMDLVLQAFEAAEETGLPDDDYPAEGVERVIEQALTVSDQQAMRRAVDAAVAGGLYPRPWTRALMFAPPQRRSVALFTVGVDRRGTLRTSCAPENWERYAGVPASNAEALLGGAAWWQCADAAELSSRTSAFEELLQDVVLPGKQRRPPWNGRDLYVILGDYAWEDCRRYGFVGARGGPVYTRPLDQLVPGARVFAYYSAPQRGYVGIGTVEEAPVEVGEFTVDVAGARVPILEAPLAGTAALREHADDSDLCSRLVRVRWDHTVDPAEAVWETGLFANQMVVCRMRDQETIDVVQEALGAI